MSVRTAAPRTERCADKLKYRTQDDATRRLVEHVRATCPTCQRGKVLDTYRCGFHWHLGHRKLGY